MLFGTLHDYERYYVHNLILHVCGAVINLRKNQDKISIWTKDAESKESVLKIGKNLKKVLNLNESVSYQSHTDAKYNKYTV